MQTIHSSHVLALRKLSRRAVWGVLGLMFAQVSLAQPPSQERVRVPTSYANVHMGPSSGQEVLVLVRRGTILTVLGRDGEWIQVQLTPEHRKTGMVMRWYKNEDRGWMHDSTVEVVKTEPR
jgi:uncharacterized protein YgiM (DUF1202 family)